jgi:hypothetical protein
MPGGCAARSVPSGRVLKSVLRNVAQPGDDLAVDDDDVQTVMQALFDIKTDLKTILDLLGDDDEEEEVDG